MIKIKYLTGDATRPQGGGKKMIAHICNDWGMWGAGFVLALSKRWRYPEDFYRATPSNCYELGKVQFVNVEEDTIVANMIAQHGVKRSTTGVPPIRYDALEKALERVNQVCEEQQCTLHMPRIGAGLAGGDWTTIEEIIERTITVPVIVYDLPVKVTEY